MADLAQIPPECKSHACRALIAHQLASIGTPHWLDPMPNPARGADHANLHMRCFCLHADAAPDEVGCGELIEGELHGDPFTVWIHELCCLHQPQLVVKKRLTAEADYLRQLCTVVNVWRSSMAKWQISKQWEATFPG